MVRKTQSSTKMGVECPRPGIGVRQAILLPDLKSHVSGASALDEAWLLPIGPRHVRQSSAVQCCCNKTVASTSKVKQVKRRPVQKPIIDVR